DFSRRVFCRENTWRDLFGWWWFCLSGRGNLRCFRFSLPARLHQVAGFKSGSGFSPSTGFPVNSKGPSVNSGWALKKS
ncbi:MAG TPA: hypothetical protein VGA43_08835, partial [Deferrimonas sp.]